MFRDLATAVRLLTIVPAGNEDGAHPGRYFALVGWAYAAVALVIASGAVWLGRASGLSAVLVAVVVVAMWGMLSGFLHWDGLADCADGFGVRGDAARRLEVMRGSTVGAFGVIAIVLVAALEIASVAIVIESRAWWALGAAPILGRWSAGMALSLHRPARPDGLAARYAARESAASIAVQLLPIAPLFVARPEHLALKAASVTMCLLVALVVPAPFVRRLGGITGDVLGATVLLTEALVLVAGALVGGVM